MLPILSMLNVVQRQTSFLGNIMCRMCQKQINQTTKNFSSKSIQKIDLTEQCASMIPNNPKECDEVAKAMFNTIIKAVNSTDVCSAFNFCSQRREETQPKEPLSTTKESLQKKYNNKCDLCKDMYGYLFGEGVEEFVIPTVQDIVKENLNKNNFTKRYADRVNSTNIKYLLSTVPVDYTPYEFCKKAELCDTIGVDL